MLDDAALPDDDDLEIRLGARLSARAGRAAYLFYDEENGAGGAAVFTDGALTSRLCFDARDTQPVRRDMTEEIALVGLDPSDWIWVPASEAIEAAAAPLVGGGIRDDDDIAALIEAASATFLTRPAAPEPAAPAPDRARKRDRVKGMMRRWLKG